MTPSRPFDAPAPVGHSSRRRRALGFTALLVLTACSGAAGGESDETVPTPGPTAAPATGAASTTEAAPPASAPRAADADGALGRYGDLLDDDGVLPLSHALEIFAAAEAPLPGITPFADLDALPHGAAGSAMRTVVAALDEVDPDVAAAVTDALALDEDLDGDALVEPTERFAREVDPSPGGASIERPTIAALREEVGRIREKLESLSGHTLSVPIRVRMPAWQHRSAQADALWTPAQCVVRVFPSTFGQDAESAYSTLAHEIWHCLQGDARRSLSGVPEWIVEGQAEFVGEVLVGGTASGAGPYTEWFVEYGRALGRRSYDALGVYGVAQEVGVDPWRTMLPMLGQPTGAALQTLFGGMSPTDAMATIAQKVTKVPDYGGEWDQVTPGPMATSGAQVVAVPLDRPVTVSESVGAYATLPVVLSVVAGGDILRISLNGGSSGAMAAPRAGTVLVEAGGQRDFCLRPDDCLCPDGTWPGGGDPPLPSGPGEFAAAIGAVAGGTLTVTAERLDRDVLCDEPTDRELVGTWQAPVANVFAELSRPYGTPPFTCDGPFLVDFGADMTFRTAFDVQCTNLGVTGRGHGELVGTYVADAETFGVVDAAGSGTMEMGGITLPLPILDGYRQGLSGPVPYWVEGDQLTYRFTAPDGNTFGFTLTRVG